jgi:hypothetical protein
MATRTIELRRCSVTGKDRLSDLVSSDGLDFAREVGQRELRMRNFTHALITHQTRSLQTLAAFMEGAAGDMRCPTFIREPTLAHDSTPEWNDLLQEHGEDLRVIAEKDPGLVTLEARKLGYILNNQMDFLPKDSNVICVMDSIDIQLIVLGLIQQHIGPLGPCEHVVLRFERDQAGGLNAKRTVILEYAPVRNPETRAAE